MPTGVLLLLFFKLFCTQNNPRTKTFEIFSGSPSYPSGPSEVTSAPWEAVPPQYDVSDFGENDNSNRVIVASPAVPNQNIQRQPQQRRYDGTEENNLPESYPHEEKNGNFCFKIIFTICMNFEINPLPFN